MKTIKIRDRNKILIEQLIEVWEKSVKATHLFLSEDEIENVKKYIPQALKNISDLIIKTDKNKTPIAFMGIEMQKLEMLFISPEYIGKGIGTELLQYAIANYAVNELCVNEQNPIAGEFYKYMGFKVYERSDIDEQGNPYPVLYMKLI